jgi:hypothetical protein
MKSRILLALSAAFATLGIVTTAKAVVVCYDYVLYRAAQNAGIADCDPNPSIKTYLSAVELKSRLRLLGYELVSGDPLTSGGQMFNTPGFAEGYLKNGDVIFQREDHVGIVNSTLAPNNPLIDHFLQRIYPDTLTPSIPCPVDHLPASGVTQINNRDAHYGFWQNDPVQEFLHHRTGAQGGGVEVWRLTRNTDVNARQWACAAPNPSDLILRLKTAGATCEVKWTSKTPDLNTRATCRSTIDGPSAANSAQLSVAADGSARGDAAEASWEGFQNLKWGWTAQVTFATFQGRGEAKCKGSDGRCRLAIPARPKGTGPAVGHEFVGASIGWDGTGPGNPVVGPPGGIGISSLQVEHGIDYRK